MEEHLIEPELQQQAPRKVRQRGTCGNGTRVAQWLMIPFVLLSVVSAGWSLHNVYVQLAGPLVPCEIVDRYKVKGDDDDLHYVVYRLPLPGKAEFPNEMVDAGSYNNVAVGSTVPLQMSPLFPGHGSILRIPGRDMTGNLIGGLFFAVLMLGMGAMLVWFIYIVPVRDRRLIVHGIPVTGRLVNKNQISTANNEVTGYYFDYEYQPSGVGSSVLTGKQRVNYAVWHQAQTGELTTVLYDPKKPAASMLYQYGDYEVIA